MSNLRRGVPVSFLMMALIVATIALDVSGQPPIPQSLFQGLHWRLIGPFRGGRVNAVCGVPGQPNTFYYGAVCGGLWKSGNAGRTWTPIFDSQPVASIGAIAIAPSNSSLLYVGTGESDMRDSISFGNGMYKSTDAGATWKPIGLEGTRQIARVVVDPKNPDIVFVAAMGHAYGPSPERGVFRSRDGGATWQKVLYKDDGVGAADLAIDPANSKILYATLWATRRPPWYVYSPSIGPGSGIYKSIDGGTTWKQLTAGLTSENLGRCGIAVAVANPNRVYAVVDAKEGGLYRSDDAGANWTKVSADNRIWGRGWYFGKIAVDPRNPDTVYVSNTALYRSMDAGKTWTPIKGAPGGDDYHQLWIAPEDPKRMIAATDQGAIITVDGALTWSSWYNQSTAQLYHIAADYRFPYWLTAAQQDSGPVAIPVRSPHSVISMHDWTGVGAGGESGYTAPDPLHPEILFGGTVSRWNNVTYVSQNVSPERGAQGGPFRHAWTQPLVFSAADPHALYFANQYLYKTTNGGENWTQISPDLTRENPGVPPNLDPAAAADVPPGGGVRRGVIYTIAPSPVRPPLVWIGTDDGYIQVTSDDGKTWRNVTPPAVTSWSKVTMIEASHFDENEAYAAVERHQLEDYEPYIYRTRDGGATWQKITDGLPAGVYVQTVKEDPVKRGLLFAGTELEVYVSFDDGDTWQSLRLDLPPTSMRDFAIRGNDLSVATHGRGIWVLDGMGVLRQFGRDTADAAALLFKPADAFITPPGSEFGTPLPKDEPIAENPPYGAFIDYYLKSAVPGPVVLEILDDAGQSVRRFASNDPITPVNPDLFTFQALWVPPREPLPASPGMHRWVWDLRRTPPAASSGPGARGAGAGGGPGAGPGGYGRGGTPVAPGTYTVSLTVGGKTYTQPLVLKPDPRVPQAPVEQKELPPVPATAAMRHIDVLAGLGVREAGTSREAQARAYIESEFNKIGLKTTVEEFPFSTYVLDDIHLRIGARSLIPAFAAFDVYGAPDGVAGPAVVIDPQKRREEWPKLDFSDKIVISASPANRFELAFLKPKAVVLLKPAELAGLKPMSGQAAKLEARGQVTSANSANLIAFLPAASATPKHIVISAHYDATGGPGASDNASGVGLLLEIARYFQGKRTPPACQLEFVALGAEELGMLGSKAFVAAHGTELADCELVFNMDTVGGGGDLYIEMRGGVQGASAKKGVSQIPPELAGKAETDSTGRWGWLQPKVLAAFAASCVPDWLKQTITSAAGELGIGFTPANYMGSDQMVFAEAGIPATNIAAAGSETHGPADTPEKISAKNLEKAAAIVVRVIEKTMERIAAGR